MLPKQQDFGAQRDCALTPEYKLRRPFKIVLLFDPQDESKTHDLAYVTANSDEASEQLVGFYQVGAGWSWPTTQPLITNTQQRLVLRMYVDTQLSAFLAQRSPEEVEFRFFERPFEFRRVFRFNKHGHLLSERNGQVTSADTPLNLFRKFRPMFARSYPTPSLAVLSAGACNRAIGPSFESAAKSWHIPKPVVKLARATACSIVTTLLPKKRKASFLE